MDKLEVEWELRKGGGKIGDSMWTEVVSSGNIMGGLHRTQTQS